MNDDTKFWIAIWRTASAVVVAVVATMAGCISYQTKQTADLINSGKDPIQVRCAMQGTSNSDAAQAAVCTAAVLHGSQK